jgi:hypothetical protein
MGKTSKADSRIADRGSRIADRGSRIADDFAAATVV